jgi:hypothetical protein
MDQNLNNQYMRYSPQQEVLVEVVEVVVVRKEVEEVEVEEGEYKG